MYRQVGAPQFDENGLIKKGNETDDKYLLLDIRQKLYKNVRKNLYFFTKINRF